MNKVLKGRIKEAVRELKKSILESNQGLPDWWTPEYEINERRARIVKLMNKLDSLGARKQKNNRDRLRFFGQLCRK